MNKVSDPAGVTLHAPVSQPHKLLNTHVACCNNIKLVFSWLFSHPHVNVASYRKGFVKQAQTVQKQHSSLTRCFLSRKHRLSLSISVPPSINPFVTVRGGRGGLLSFSQSKQCCVGFGFTLEPGERAVTK